MLYIGIVRRKIDVRVNIQKFLMWLKMSDFYKASYPTFPDFGHFDLFLVVQKFEKLVKWVKITIENIEKIAKIKILVRSLFGLDS